VAFSGGVDYDVQMIKGFANVFAGGEGLFMTTLTGPGTVWLQGQPPQRMISEIARRVPSGGGLGLAIPIGGMGGGGGGGEGGDGGTTGSTGQ
jgi:Mitochondrial biogenesis AIM24